MSRKSSTSSSSQAPSGQHHFRVLSPREIYAGLEEHVIGQESVKTGLAVAVHAHYLRLYAKARQAAELVPLHHASSSSSSSLSPPADGNTMTVFHNGTMSNLVLSSPEEMATAHDIMNAASHGGHPMSSTASNSGVSPSRWIDTPLNATPDPCPLWSPWNWKKAMCS